MSLIEWDKKFELGIQQIDEHHKHLVSLLNKTYEFVTCDAGNHTLEAVLVELIDYASYHFAAEERWMKAHDYPKLPQHEAEHERFTKRVEQIQKDFFSGKTELTLDVLVFLKNWLSFHILSTDAEYGRFAAGHPLV